MVFKKKRIVFWGLIVCVGALIVFTVYNYIEYKKSIKYLGLYNQESKGGFLVSGSGLDDEDSLSRNVNKRREAVRDLAARLEARDEIEQVSIDIKVPDWKLMKDLEHPWKASVVIRPAPFSYILSNKLKIREIKEFIASEFIYMKSDGVTVFDKEGNEAYGFTDEELDFVLNYDIKYRMGEELFQEEEDEQEDAE